MVEIRWRAGEEYYRRSRWVPGAFLMVWGLVLMAKWLGHFAVSSWYSLRLIPRLVRRALRR
jgi:hypothetical protein